MARKLRFKPEISRVRLNPEQAVLICACAIGGGKQDAGTLYWSNHGSTHECCWVSASRKGWYYRCDGSGGGTAYRLTSSATSS